jgi:hypothetical protein
MRQEIPGMQRAAGRSDVQQFCRRRMGPTTVLLGLFMAVSSSVNLLFTRRILARVENNHEELPSPLLIWINRTSGISSSIAPPSRRRISVVARGLGSSPFIGGAAGYEGGGGDNVHHKSKLTPSMNHHLSASENVTPSNDIPVVQVPPSNHRQHGDTLNSCVWGPTFRAQCAEMLRERLTLPLSRLLFFGDSTIHNLVNEGVILEQALVKDALKHCPHSSCQIRTTEKCNRTYGLPGTAPNELWRKPDLTTGEGPIAFGYGNPGCSDCSNCNSRFLDCRAKEPEKRCLVPHGGYVYMEFARDVVWQTARYRTTQENTADFLRDGLAIYPNTACVMAAGLHDMDVFYNNNNVTVYIQNVRWYLSLYLKDVCRHVVWLANASPASDNYTQTIARTNEWNEAVRQELSGDNFLNTTTYIDLWSASQTWPHANNLHMDVPWNMELSQLFTQLWFRTKPISPSSMKIFLQHHP